MHVINNMIRKIQYDIRQIKQGLQTQKNNIIDTYSKQKKSDNIDIINNGGNFANIELSKWNIDKIQGNFNAEATDHNIFQIGNNTSIEQISCYVILFNSLLIGQIPDSTLTMKHILKEKFIRIVPSDLLPSSKFKIGALLILGNNLTKYFTLGIVNKKPFISMIFNEPKNQLLFLELNEKFKLYANYRGLVCKINNKNIQLGINICNFVKRIYLKSIEIYNAIIGIYNISLFGSIMIRIPINALGGNVIIEIKYEDEFVISIRFVLNAALHYSLHI